MIKEPTLLILGQVPVWIMGFHQGNFLVNDIINFLNGRKFGNIDDNQFVLSYILWFSTRVIFLDNRDDSVKESVSQSRNSLAYTGEYAAIFKAMTVPYQYLNGETALYGVSRKGVDAIRKLANVNEYTLAECNTIVKTFTKMFSNPSAASIDDFINIIQNSTLDDKELYVSLAKIVVTILISQYEDEDMLNPVANEKGEYVIAKGWYSYLWKRIYENCPRVSELKISLRNLSIVTFNYERSLEKFLFSRIMSMYGLGEEDAEIALKEVNIHHVYGQMGQFYDDKDKTKFNEYKKIDIYPMVDILKKVRYQEGKHLSYSELLSQGNQNIIQWTLDRSNNHSSLLSLISISQGIKTYGEADVGSIDKADLLYKSVNRLFYLGFGFHPQNLNWLDEHVLSFVQMRANTYGTVYRLGLSEYKGLFITLKELASSKNITFNNIDVGAFSDEDLTRNYTTNNLKELKIVEFLSNIPDKSI